MYLPIAQINDPVEEILTNITPFTYFGDRGEEGIIIGEGGSELKGEDSLSRSAIQIAVAADGFDKVDIDEKFDGRFD